MNKMAKNQKVEKPKIDGFKNEIIMLLPILFIVTIFLFCVRGRVVPTHLSGMFWYSGGEYAGDIYAYFRMQAFVLVTIVFTLYMLFNVFTGELKLAKHKVYIPMIVYSVFVVVSYLAAEYKEIALWGALQRYEGTITLLCYMVILFYSMNAVRSDKAVGIVVKCFAVASAVLGVWGIMQFFGTTLEAIPEWLYIPSSIRESASIQTKQFTEAVTLFFSNQNYTSFFLIFPVCVFALAAIAAEKTIGKVLYAAITGVMLFCLWQASSLGGMVGIAASVVAAVVLAGFENIKKWYKSLIMLVVAGALATGASLPVIMKEAGVKVSSALGFVKVYADENIGELRFVPIDYIITEGKDIVFGMAGKEIRIETEEGLVKSVKYSDGEEVSPESSLLRVSSHTDEETGYLVIDAKTAYQTWMFTVYNGEAFFFSPTGKGIKLDKVESMGFEDNQNFGSNRGYIWSRTLPLVKETVLIGKGADTYAAHFPHEDYAGKYSIGYYNSWTNTIVDKPHSMYLGSAVNTGVISMVALIAIYLIYVIESIKTYWKKEYTMLSDYIGLGIFVAIIGFLVAGLVNDSTVQMMPVVYALLGTGFAINRMKKERTQK